MTKLLLNIEACKNIISGELELQTEQINIKYAQNGTGKSTIGEALYHHVNGSLSSTIDLQSFLSKEKPSLHIHITDQAGVKKEANDYFKHAEIFNEDFVNNFAFIENQAIADSFNVFIKSSDYDEKKAALEEKLSDLKTILNSDAALSEMISALRSVSVKFTMTNSGTIALKGVFKDALNPSNVYLLPTELSKYKPFIQNDDRVSWITWKSQGYQYAKEPLCPFCAKDIPNEEIQKDQEIFDASYSKSVVKNQKELEDFLITLKPYLDAAHYEVLLGYTRKIDNIDDFKHEFHRFINEINLLLQRVTEIVSFSTYGLSNADLPKLEEKLNSYRINESLYIYFNCTKTLEIFSSINSRIESAIQKIGEIKAGTVALNKIVRDSIQKSNADINDFLALSGINYQFILSSNADNASFAQLIYNGTNPQVAEKANLRKCLSWGERNAISLVLFIYFANSRKSDLIILDDPISSFDKSKKFAIVKRLFQAPSAGQSLLKQTVLFLSHDFEPIIDLYYEQRFQQKYANATYLTNVNGQLNEQQIDPSKDIQPITVLYIRDMTNANLELVFRLVALRKHLEYVEEFCSNRVEYHFVSSLLKCRERPMIKKGLNDPGQEMTADQIEYATTAISIMMCIPKEDVNYVQWLQDYFNEASLLQSLKTEQRNFYRIQLLRCLFAMDRPMIHTDDEVLIKYFNSCFHIENDYSHFLDYTIFDPVPPFISARLNSAFAKIL